MKEDSSKGFIETGEGNSGSSEVESSEYITLIFDENEEQIPPKNDEEALQNNQEPLPLPSSELELEAQDIPEVKKESFWDVKEKKEHKVKKEKPEKIKKPKKPKKERNTKKLLIILGSIFGVMLAGYVGVSLYFSSHFMFNSVVNGVNVSGKSTKAVEELLSSLADGYILTLNGRNNTQEEIQGKEINLEFQAQGNTEKLVKEQNPFSWPVVLVTAKESSQNVPVKYDQTLLNESIKKLQMVSGPNIVRTENPQPKYNGTSYEIVEGKLGNQLDEEKLKKKIETSITEGKKTLDLDGEDCYFGTTFTKDSPQVIEAKQSMNKYISSVVTYTFGDAKEVLDKNTINTWLGVDDKMVVTINQESVNTYVNSLAAKYDTYGNQRNFQTSYGSVISVPGGDYGWLIDTEGEVAELSNIIKNGQSVTREPVYASTGGSRGERDYGNTYIEISLDGQHMWFYKNGALVVDTDIVTGSLSGGYGTPAGFFSLDYKDLNVTLRGEGYASPVTFWLPYDGDIGIHDASWRGSYGGSIYVNDGSHGCVNTPYAAVEVIFNGIEPGDPVVVY